MNKPSIKPNNPRFSSGPTTKFKGWSLDCLKNALVGRSHRSGPAKQRLKHVIDLHREVLKIPDDYRIAIVPASDTGAVEMAMWSLLGVRGVDVLAWENFSNDWLIDCRDHLKIEDLRIFESSYGALPDLTTVDTDRDVIFAWNGTTSGACVPNADWIKADRKGLTICDATSAVFAYAMPWEKLDVVTWSWQKVLGSEAAHGMLVLSPRAVERLETYTPPWPLPKLFRMTKKGKINDGLFAGATINTPSMLAVEDCLAALNWVKSIGGLDATIEKSQSNYEVVKQWVDASSIFAFLTENESIRSRTSLCLCVKDPWFLEFNRDAQVGFIKQMVAVLDKEGVACDCNAYRTAPPGLRLWGGATVEVDDLQALLPWIDWAYEQTKQGLQNATQQCSVG